MSSKTFILIIALVFTSLFLVAQSIRVESGTCIRVESGTSLDVTNGNLVLKSDASGNASLIDYGNISYSGGGEAKIERYLTNDKWHMISAPTAGAVSGMFEGDYLIYHTEATNDWSYILALDYPLTAAHGFMQWNNSGVAVTKVFEGITNSGNQSYNFTQNGDGYNLVGNPYPSVLDWDAVMIPAQLSGAIWIFDPTVGINGDYKYYINGGAAANTTTQFVPSGQGFFVKSIGGAGTLNFRNTDRTHGGQLFYKENQANSMLVLKTIGNKISTQTAIRFIPEATQQIDRLYDVHKLIADSPEVPLIYTLSENQKMAINTLPSIAGNETIPVYFKSGLDGTYEIQASQMETLGPEVSVMLEDVFLSYYQDLRLNANYFFEYNAGTVKEFKIHFKEATGIDEYKSKSPFFNGRINKDKLIVTYVGEEAFKGSAVISLLNLAGQQMIQSTTINPFTEISFIGSAGIYVVHVLYRNQNYVIKVINQ